MEGEKVNTNLEGLRKEEFVEEVPCGRCITTRYLDADGKVMRQDIRIEVIRGAETKSGTGEL